MSFAALSLSATASLANAQTASDTLREVARCSAIADGAERLRCYDMAAPRAKEGLAPSARDFGRPAPPPPLEVAEISAMVREFSKTAHGRAVFVLDNGQIWRQLDADNVVVQDPDPAKPLKITISHGMFGSYNLAIEGRNGIVKVRRLE
jgi:hypothetical protein